MTREFSEETFIERNATAVFVVLVVSTALVFAYRTIVPVLHGLLALPA